MVDPKKDYELLMRYLQGGAKRNSTTMPDKTYTEDWHPPQKHEPETTNIWQVKWDTLKTALRSRFKLPHVSWPKWEDIPFWKRIRLAIAALALLILLVVTWKAYTFFSLTPETIYNKLYVPYAAVRSESVLPNSIEQYYLDSNYVAATLKAKKQKQLSDKEKLLTGLAYLQREDYTAAIKWLEPAANNFKSPYRQQAEFYLALTYLKNEDYDRCIVRMEHIAYTPSNPYQGYISKSTINDIKMLKWK